MDYVFLDTSAWINFACGKNHESKFDYTTSNRDNLEGLIALKESNSFILLKNEIIDLEFKEATIEPLIKAYQDNIIQHFKSILGSKIIPHCKTDETRSVFRNALLQVEEFGIPFRELSESFNLRVKTLYESAKPINVSENLKQKALNFGITKDHVLFKSRQNNINDYLILYSIQEWIESNDQLKILDETTRDHTVYFVTKNVKDFGISKDGFDPNLGLSQLIVPIYDLGNLVSLLKAKKNEPELSVNFPLRDDSEFVTDAHTISPIDKTVDTLEKLIRLKREFFISYLKNSTSALEHDSKLKYLIDFVEPQFKNIADSGHYILRSQNLKNYQMNVNDLIQSANKQQTSLSQKGDILIISFGSRMGEHALNNLDTKVEVHQSVYVLRVNQSKLIPEYLDYLFRYQRFGTDGAVIPRLSLPQLKNLKIKLPTLDQQESLVSRFRQKEREIAQDIALIKRKIQMILA
ncbi:restriction endonuclease subunit S [Fulvivirga ligni]|uniref:restriction endonuclease subunit S n=1 Tax=Fulvivirga ligni TaxID=2904246 RepID=UPI001F1D05F7|nr:restriction endonuclease subunit S [Fulvivirga ligni]UII21658.1 restriction endonuclease subunit S [Fulvivirga ligni]